MDGRAYESSMRTPQGPACPRPGEVALDGEVLEILHRAVGTQGVWAVAQHLGLRAAIGIRNLLRGMSDALTPTAAELLAAAVAGGRADERTMRSALAAAAATQASQAPKHMLPTVEEHGVGRGRGAWHEVFTMSDPRTERCRMGPRSAQVQSMADPAPVWGRSGDRSRGQTRRCQDAAEAAASVAFAGAAAPAQAFLPS